MGPCVLCFKRIGPRDALIRKKSKFPCRGFMHAHRPTGPSPRIFCPCPAPGHLPPPWLPYPPCLLTHPPPLTTSAGIQASPLNPCRILSLRRPFPLGPAFPPSAPQLGHPTHISRRRFFNHEPEDAEATRNSSSLCDRGDATAGEGGGKGISLTR